MCYFILACSGSDVFCFWCQNLSQDFTRDLGDADVVLHTVSDIETQDTPTRLQRDCFPIYQNERGEALKGFRRDADLLQSKSCVLNRIN